MQNLPFDKNGYLFIYVSNSESSIPVYFDNLQVTHIRGPIVEETHYYPFGLTMAGISSKAVEFGKPLNTNNKFQNQEFNNDLDVNIYEFKYRMHDPQIGRFWQVDPLADKYLYNSTYAFSENHVTTHVELEGLEKKEVNKKGKLPWENYKSWTPDDIKEKENASKNANNDNEPKANIGVTITAKAKSSQNLIDLITGDKVSVYSYKSTRKGDPGKIASLDITTTTDEKAEEIEPSVILGNDKTGSISASSDMKGSGSLGLQTREGIGMNVGFEVLKGNSILSVSLEGGYTSPSGDETGVGVNISAGDLLMIALPASKAIKASNFII